ncbi:hypothetical protein ABZ930_31230 [Streptomyces sp. NPDC046716]|uniref:hypothetical protein n=1 Tax=Streptomyces sp. NPDC046716 TaxID=3157093 RepID=UPI0033FA3E8D
MDHSVRGRRRAARVAAAAAIALGATPASTAAADGAAPGTELYVQQAQFTGVGKPLDLLLHPTSGKLYVGADNLAATADIDERGLYVLDPATGAVRSQVTKAPNSAGALATVAVRRFAGPQPGADDGVVFNYPLRGVGSAKDGDAEASGVWLTGSTVSDIGPGVRTGTTLVAQGTVLCEIETATGTVLRSVQPGGSGPFAVDAARGTVWYLDTAAGLLHRLETDGLTVTGSYQLPAAQGNAAAVVEVDPADGSVWVGRGDTVTVHAADGTPRGTLKGTDWAGGVGFDPTSGRAYVVRQDSEAPGTPGSDGNGIGSLTVYDAKTLTEATAPVALKNSSSQYGSTAVAVTPGGGEVFVTNPNPAAPGIVKLVRQVSPEVTRQPVDVTAEAGSWVELTAVAQGSPEPTVRWQSSADNGKTWQDVEGADHGTYSFTAEVALDGAKFRAEFINDAGAVRTNPVTLTVTATDTGSPSPGESEEPDAGSDPENGPDEDGGGGEDGDASPSSQATSVPAGLHGTGESGSTTGDHSGEAAAGPTGGSLASTGASVLSAAGAAAALIAGGAVAVRRARRRGAS